MPPFLHDPMLLMLLLLLLVLSFPCGYKNRPVNHFRNIFFFPFIGHDDQASEKEWMSEWKKIDLLWVFKMLCIHFWLWFVTPQTASKRFHSLVGLRLFFFWRHVFRICLRLSWIFIESSSCHHYWVRSTLKDHWIQKTSISYIIITYYACKWLHSYVRLFILVSTSNMELITDEAVNLFIPKMKTFRFNFNLLKLRVIFIDIISRPLFGKQKKNPPRTTRKKEDEIIRKSKCLEREIKSA